MIKKINLLILVFLLFQLNSIADEQDRNTIIPTSPNAASLAMYADYPVSYYTGVPNISIPLYEINVDGFKLPISLSYHSKGIQVNQEASWVGLGWALNCGGSISRTVKGVDDFLEFPNNSMTETCGYFNCPDMTSPFLFWYPIVNFDCQTLLCSDNINVNYFDLETGGNQWVDSEADLFFYSLPGLSGKFVLDKARGAVLFDKSQNLKIEVVNSYHKNFVITTSDGVKYIFDQREISSTYSSIGSLNNNYTDGPPDLDAGSFIDPKETRITSGWCLSKIITSNKREISFVYVPEFYQSPTQESGKIINDLVNPHNTTYPNSVSKTSQNNWRLSEIIWDGGSIIFSPSDREDMYGSTKRLDKINIYDKNNNVVKGYDFNYSYFNNNYTNATYQHVYKRLKLESLKERGTDDSFMNQGTSFSYFDGELPPKNSKNTDYWGYNNGADYKTNYCMAYTIGTSVYGGAIKYSNFDFLKIGTLNQINYSTGGSANFTYELNDFTNSFSGPTVFNNVGYTVFNKYQDESTGESGYPETITDTITTAFISISAYIDNQYQSSADSNFIYDDPNHPVAVLRRITPTEETVINIPMMSVFNNRTVSEMIYDGNGNYLSCGCQSIDGSGVCLENFDDQSPTEQIGDGRISVVVNNSSLISVPGVYIFEAKKPPRDVRIDWELKFSGTSTYSSNNVVNTGNSNGGGGLRIAQINSGNKIREFNYNNSGLLLVAPFMVYTKGNNLVQLSEPLLPLTTIGNGNYQYLQHY